MDELTGLVRHTRRTLMLTRNLFALSLVAALGAAIPAAHADYDHGNGRDYRNDHRDFERDRRERERHEEFLRHDHRVYDHGHGYVVERPVYAPPRVVYAAPPVVYAPPAPASLNINIPLQLP